MHVLMVDDSELFRALFRSVLAAPETGITLDQGWDLASATALLHRRRVDVAYLDIGLPDGNGLDLMEPLNRANPAVVVACCTCHDLPEYREEARRLGAQFFLPKASVTRAQILSVLAAGRRIAGPRHHPVGPPG